MGTWAEAPYAAPNTDAAFGAADVTLRQIVHGAVHIGVLVAIVVIHRAQHGFGLLRGRAIVQIGETAAAHRLHQDRKIGADARQVERPRSGRVGAGRADVVLTARTP